MNLPRQQANETTDATAFHQRGRAIFEKVLPELIENYYNWFILIEPESGDYFIDEDELAALAKARQKYPQATFTIFRLNETGICGRV